MNSVDAIFDHSVCFDPQQPLEALLTKVPARWVVYLLADADGRPIQLLCVKNLRASLKRRLADDPVDGPTRKVRYPEIVRRVYWRRVDSAFEADLAYADAARVLYPQNYSKLISARPAWFLHVDPEAPFPRYRPTDDLSIQKGELIGPLETKSDAGKLAALTEDLFDLCRYHNVLTQSPNGQACAYAQMHKCPAPCDGSISLQQYRALVAWSARIIVEPEEFIREQQQRMRLAAEELRFELAGKIKQFVGQLQELGAGPFRHAKRIEDFAFVSFQSGPRDQTAKVFLITPGRIDQIAGIVREPAHFGDLLRLVLTLAHGRSAERPDSIGAERIGLVAHHLFWPKDASGSFLRLDRIDETSLASAYRTLQKQKRDLLEQDDEGIVREVGAS